jgi:hypothetical protein
MIASSPQNEANCSSKSAGIHESQQSATPSRETGSLQSPLSGPDVRGDDDGSSAFSIGILMSQNDFSFIDGGATLTITVVTNTVKTSSMISIARSHSRDRFANGREWFDE